MKKSILYGWTALVWFSFASTTAHAQYAIGQMAFGGGTYFSQKVYRQLMDCMYFQAQGSSGKPGPFPKAASCAAFDGSSVVGVMLYAGTSGPEFNTNDKKDLREPYVTSIPYTDSTFGINNISDYDGVQFVGREAVVTAADVAAWSSAGNPDKFGNIVQIPALVGAVGIGFNGKDGRGAPLNILPAIPVGGSSGLNLSRQALCGIVSGHITKWDNPILTSLNGSLLGTGNITFVHSWNDSETLMLSTALVAQCRQVFGPMNESNPTIVSYAFPWTDTSASCAGPLVPVGAFTPRWPDQYASDSCGNPITNPGGGIFANASTAKYVATLVAVTNGAIGYAPAEYWLPAKVGGLKTANLQNEWDLTIGTGQFHAPSSECQDCDELGCSAVCHRGRSRQPAGLEPPRRRCKSGSAGLLPDLRVLLDQNVSMLRVSHERQQRAQLVHGLAQLPLWQSERL